MIEIQGTKMVCFGTLGPIATNATSNHYVDTLGYEHAEILAITAEAAATNSSTKWTSMVLGHAPTTDVSNVTAINGATGTTNATATSAQFVLPAWNDTSVKQTIRFSIDLTNKERYLHLKVQASTAAMATTAFLALLSRGHQIPNTATELGGSVVVFV